MSKQPEKRYQSASEMALELRRYVLIEKRDQKQESNKTNPGWKPKEDSYGRLFWISCFAISIAALVALGSWLQK